LRERKGESATIRIAPLLLLLAILIVSELVGFLAEEEEKGGGETTETGEETTTAVAWVDEEPPANAILYTQGDEWSWVSADPTPFSGTQAHQSNAADGIHQHYFEGATDTLSVDPGTGSSPTSTSIQPTPQKS
jgi:hypothetical protein